MTGPSRDFHHPFQPYEIQEQFMTALYECIERGNGKSLSIICGSLTWLNDHKKKAFELQLQEEDVQKDEPDWMNEYARKQKRQTALQQKAEVETRLAKIRAKEKRQKEKYERGEPMQKKLRGDNDHNAAAEDDEDQFALDEYNSEEGNDQNKSATSYLSDNGLSAATQELMRKLGMDTAVHRDEEEELGDVLKIFYCSRTHSQLTQFVNELRRVHLPSVIADDETEATKESIEVDIPVEEEIKHLTLGSRKNLCINSTVRKLASGTAINERCLELQQPSTPREKKCQYLPTKENEALVNDFRDHTLANIRDIEDLGALGKKLGICPYYASRRAIHSSEIITLPYPLLLSKSAREALNISLKNHVIIIDEAHNLMDAISSIHSITVSLRQLSISRSQIGAYLQKFRNRLKGKNRIYVTQTVRVVDSLSSYLQKMNETSRDSEDVVDVGDLMAGKGVDQINLYRLMRYLQDSKFARKVQGYTILAESRESMQRHEKEGSRVRQPTTSNTATTPILTHIQGLLMALMNPSAEGRIFYCKTDDGADICLKYMLLDPAYHFKDIVEDARAVILAGGTMSPMSDYSKHLFPYVSPDHLQVLSCGHVIPPENLLAWPVRTGPSGLEFEFTYDKRNQPTMIMELGRALLNLCLLIPDGVITFFPSYAYLEQVVQRWRESPLDTSKPVWERLCQRKQVFSESKENASVEETLLQYSKAIDVGKGGLLLAVIGGKVSEGINFSDKLGRGVIVVGLPFPNIQSAEWKAKLEHIEQMASDGGANQADAKAAGQEYYENACMRAVNQSIGRAIRHQNDYATIVLLDKRYHSSRIQGKLPGWIKSGLAEGAGRKPFAEVLQSLSIFFRSKRAS
ncbi:MAG: ATP-dependent DNA helicase chl1 [Pycnora praestabilis]|nr:MAG: ATP-dependent DNA helicase chl1 [Pycnora praestabilis]